MQFWRQSCEGLTETFFLHIVLPRSRRHRFIINPFYFKKWYWESVEKVGVWERLYILKSFTATLEAFNSSNTAFFRKSNLVSPDYFCAKGNPVRTNRIEFFNCGDDSRTVTINTHELRLWSTHHLLVECLPLHTEKRPATCLSAGL